MITTTPHAAVHTVTPQVSTTWLASVLVGASLAELTILRIGTRTAIHIPGLEKVPGPYRMFAATGRLAFFAAVVLLSLLLPTLAADLYRRRAAHAATGVVSFVLVAGLGSLRLVGNDVMAPAVCAIVASLAIVVLSHQPREVVAVVGAFVVAFLAAGVHAVIQGGLGGGLPEGLNQLPRAAEWLAVLAAVASGPVVRRSLALAWFPSSRLAWVAVTAGLVVTGALLANASTVHILMLWNFGLTGFLPDAVYGLAVTSFVVAVASSIRHGQQHLGLALALFFLGGIGLTSTYQSGLVVAGLGLISLARDQRSHPDRSSEFAN
jgi:hypothetical protein